MAIVTVNYINITRMGKMSNKFLSFFLIFSFCFVLCSPAYSTPTEISKLRIKRIADIIRRYMRANEKLTDPYVREAIFDEVGREMNLEPDEKPNETSIQDIARGVREKVNQRFPDTLEHVKAKAQQEADAKYRMAEKLDPVTVNVVKGRKSYTVSGIFYGYGVGGKSVRIGENTPIAFFDLDPVSRAMFDEEFCDQEKRNYVDDKIRNYFHRKGNFTSTLFNEERGKISEENEALGYIYIWDRWRTPRNVTENLIEQMRTKQDDQIAGIGDTKKPVDVTTIPGTGPGDTDPGTPDIPTFTAKTPGSEEEDSRKLKVAKLRKAIEEKQLEIAGSHYGVDADQGFVLGGKRVLWNLSKEDVLMIFQEDITSDKTAGNVLSIDYGKEGAINKIDFHFLNDIFYRVDTVYNIGPEEAMGFMWKKLVESYGESAESKAMREAEAARKERIESNKNLCQPDKKTKKPTHEWDEKGICKKCGALKTDIEVPLPPLDQVYTWQGDITKAELYVSFTSDRKGLSKFILIKRHPEIEAEQTAISDAEKKRRLEEEKKKRLDEFRKPFEQ